MNKTGRIALLVNLGLSLGLAAWAIAVYTNRVDWSAQKTAETVGEYALRDDTIKNLRDSVMPKAVARWSAAASVVDDLEARRPKLQEWHAKELDNLRSGMKPIQALVVKDGSVEVDPASGAPRLGPVLDLNRKPIQGLASVATLNQT